MRKVDGLFMLDEVASENVKERFQGFEGLIVCTNGSANTVVLKESYYDDQEYKLTKTIATAFDIDSAASGIPSVKNGLICACKENK